MSDELLLRRALVCASGIVYWAGVLIQARRVRRHIGRSPNLKPRSRKERALWIGWFLVILVWVVQPLLLRPVAAQAGSPDLALSPFNLGIWSLNRALRPEMLPLGAALLALGYAGTLWCYAAMGDAWRIGVNRAEKNALVTSGPYRRMRHPIYSFQIVMLFGAALLLPTLLSFGILVLHVACVWIKACDEEAYLRTVHPGAYDDYLRRTGRLFPKVL